MVADESDRPMAPPRVQLGDYCERVGRNLRSHSEGNSLGVGSPKSSFPGPPGWGLGIGPTTLSPKKILEFRKPNKRKSDRLRRQHKQGKGYGLGKN